MRLLIIGKTSGPITQASKIAMNNGAKVSISHTIDDALATLRSGLDADVIMIDVAFDTQYLVDCMAAERMSMPILACGIGHDTKAAVNAIKAGAKEFVPLPPDPELIGAILGAITQENDTIIANDPKMKAVLELAGQVAPSDASVLITGESGTGKEVVARYVHDHSTRSSKPFISINCAAIPDNLLESELFGHEKGAFTGAIARKIGKFEAADGGTLLLDEISEMDARLQAKLLRAIQEREIDRVGGSNPIKVNIRLLATSNRNLVDEVKAGRFREDLYFRLNVIHIKISPLRLRPLDIEELAFHFSEKYSEANHCPTKTISKNTLTALKNHPWSGNVRELENTIHRSIILSGNNQIIEPENLKLEATQSFSHSEITAIDSDHSSAQHTNSATIEEATTLVGKTVAEVEKGLIIDTLKHCFGNRTHAANILGISIRTLRNKLKIYNDQGTSIPDHGDHSRTAI